MEDVISRKRKYIYINFLWILKKINNYFNYCNRLGFYYQTETTLNEYY